MTVTCPVDSQLSHKFLVEQTLWDRVVVRISRENGCDPHVAARIADQALGYLRLVALEPGMLYSPSPTVDIGWHTLILYTREYAALCQALAGHFIHHTPLDEPDVVYTTNAVARTMAAMKVRGLAVDEELWDGTVGDCGGHKCYTCVD